MKTEMEIRATIRQFVIDNFLMGDTLSMLTDGESFVATGTVDSIGILEVTDFLETIFALQVDDRDLVPENLDSVNNLTQYVLRRQYAA